MGRAGSVLARRHRTETSCSTSLSLRSDQVGCRRIIRVGQSMPWKLAQPEYAVTSAIPVLSHPRRSPPPLKWLPRSTPKSQRSNLLFLHTLPLGSHPRFSQPTEPKILTKKKSRFQLLRLTRCSNSQYRKTLEHGHDTLRMIMPKVKYLMGNGTINRTSTPRPRHEGKAAVRGLVALLQKGPSQTLACDLPADIPMCCAFQKAL